MARLSLCLLLAAVLLGVCGDGFAVGATPPGSAASVGAHLPPNALPTPDQLTPEVFPPVSQTVPPEGFTTNARQAVRIASREKAVVEAERKQPDVRGHAFVSALPTAEGTFYHWDVRFRTQDRELVEVQLTGTGRVLVVTTAPDVGWGLVLGLPGILGKKLNAPYVWLPLCLLFLLPFVDPRRPFRLLHLDLLVLLLFGISHFFFNLGQPAVSVPLVYPFLIYVVVRGLAAAVRPRRRPGPLAPFVSTRFLLVGVCLLMALRIAFGIAGSGIFDVSTAGVIGADRIEHGQPLYQDNSAHGDTYGPVNYMLYIPAELAFPWNGTGKVGSAARATTLAVDILVALGLVLLGRRLRPGPGGRRLGALLGWGWAAFPYSALVLASNTNDAFVALFVVYALLAISSPARRGVISAIGTMTKFAPALLAPLFATGRGPFRWRPVLIVVAAYVVVCGGLILAFLPDGGLREFWNTTLGYQLHRQTPLSIWVRHPGIAPIRPLFTGLAIALGIASAFVPRRRMLGQIAGWSAAILAAIQISGNYWIYFYIVWFAPFLLIAVFEEYRDLGPIGPQERVTSSLVKPEMMSQPSSVTATRSSMRTPSLPGT